MLLVLCKFLLLVVRLVFVFNEFWELVVMEIMFVVFWILFFELDWGFLFEFWFFRVIFGFLVLVFNVILFVWLFIFNKVFLSIFFFLVIFEIFWFIFIVLFCCLSVEFILIRVGFEDVELRFFFLDFKREERYYLKLII